VRKRERVFLLGTNGSGKTTLFKILMKQLAPENGTVTYGAGVKAGYYDQLMTGLSDNKTVMDEIWDAYPKMSQTQVRTALGSFLFSGEDVFKKIGVLSGGEKARVALLKLMLSGCNFLLLDEPTNHLDINSREALEDAISGYNGTVFIISHDRYLINKTATRLYKLGKSGTVSINGGYDDFLAASEGETVLTAAKAKEPSASDSANKLDYKRRKEIQSDIRKLTTRVTKAEARIAELETEIEKTNAAMASPEISADYEKVAELSHKLSELQSELDSQTEQWLSDSEELETLKTE
jgi:ATP-binding cassette subfamily F protein 3